ELGRVGEGLRGVVVLLQVLERQALEEEGHPRFTGPLQVFQPRAVPAQEHFAHPQAEISLGLRILLLPLANIGHGIAERPVTRGVAAQHLAQIRHRGNIKRRPVHDRADVGGHHLGHAINSPVAPPWFPGYSDRHRIIRVDFLHHRRNIVWLCQAPPPVIGATRHREGEPHTIPKSCRLSKYRRLLNQGRFIPNWGVRPVPPASQGCTCRGGSPPPSSPCPRRCTSRGSSSSTRPSPAAPIPCAPGRVLLQRPVVDDPELGSFYIKKSESIRR